MKFVSEPLDIETSYHHGAEALLFTFHGKLTSESSAPSIAAWHQELSLHPTDQFVFVWNFEKIDSIDISALRLWRQFLLLHKAQIAHIIIIANSLVLRAFVKSWLELSHFTSTVFSSKERFHQLREQVIRL